MRFSNYPDDYLIAYAIERQNDSAEAREDAGVAWVELWNRLGEDEFRRRVYAASQILPNVYRLMAAAGWRRPYKPVVPKPPVLPDEALFKQFWKLTEEAKDRFFTRVREARHGVA